MSIQPAVLLKRSWDLLGVVLVLLQLSSHFLSNSANTGNRNNISFLWLFKRTSHGGNDDSILGFLNIHIFVDIYFLIDVVVRLSTSRYAKQSPDLKTQRLRTCWFIIDLLLIFPHGFCWQLWQSRPALQLLNIRQGRRPIFEFFRSRDFRKKIFQLIREHREEKKLFRSLKGLLLGGGSVIVAGRNSALALPVSRLRSIISLGAAVFRKTGNLFARFASSWRKYQHLKLYSSVVRWISWMAMSVRAVYISRLSALDNGNGDDITSSAISPTNSGD